MKKLNHKFFLTIIILLALVLRFYHLGSNPPSPYWEEAAIGYDAYSILKTGKDFHGNPWPLVAFESFGDYKPSLYFYTAVPAIALFGLNTFAVRFPSALFGTLTILLIYLLTKQLFSKKNIEHHTSNIALLASLMLAISPWHLQLSRAGFEANLGLFFVVLGVWLFLRGLKKSRYLLFSVLSFVLAIYTYHASRLFVPLLGVGLGLIFLNQLKSKKKLVVASIVLLISLVLPLLAALNSPQVKQRFQETSALAAADPVIKSNQLIQADGNTWLARFIHHRFWHYKNIFLDHYLDHFNLEFLFLSGDSNPRHSIQLVGGLYIVQLPLFLIGLYFLLTRRSSTSLLILTWLLLAPIPAGFTKATPHALRSLPMIIPLTIISAYGLVQLIKLKQFPYLKLLIAAVLIVEFSRYLFIYHLDYPRQHASHWQYGYQQAMTYVIANQHQYDHIYFTRKLGRPSIYYWFYHQTDPRSVQRLNPTALKDKGEFLEFNNLSFSLIQDSPFKPNSLIIASQAESVPGQLVKSIQGLNHETIFNLYQF